MQIPEGALFYGEPRRREKVAFSPDLRGAVRSMLEEMHGYARRDSHPR